MAVNPSTTKKKNSGILRYKFGFTPDGNTDPDAIAGPLNPGAVVILTCLGPDGLINTDTDDQAFGTTAGFPAAILSLPNTLFALAAPIAPWDRVVPSQQPKNLSGFSNLDGYIPQGSKITVSFAMSSVGAGDAPSALVQFRSLDSRQVVGGVVAPTGPTSLTFLQVAVVNAGLPNGPAMAGVLTVRIEHSLIDIPGFGNQAEVNNANGGA